MLKMMSGNSKQCPFTFNFIFFGKCYASDNNNNSYNNNNNNNNFLHRAYIHTMFYAPNRM